MRKIGKCDIGGARHRGGAFREAMQGGIASMTSHRELLAFAAVLTALVAGFLGESLLRGKVLSPADVLRVSASFRDARRGRDYEPANRLLMDPVLQFQPWLEFNRRMIRRGRLPLWNDLGGLRGASPGERPERGLRPVPRDRLPRHAPRSVRLDGRRAALGGRGWGCSCWPGRWGLGPWGRWFAGLVVPVLRLPGRLAALPGHERRGLDALAVLGERPGACNAPSRGRSAAGPGRGALVLLGGHVQTSAHVLLAARACVLAAWRTRLSVLATRSRRGRDA